MFRSSKIVLFQDEQHGTGSGNKVVSGLSARWTVLEIK